MTYSYLTGTMQEWKVRVSTNGSWKETLNQLLVLKNALTFIPGAALGASPCPCAAPPHTSHGRCVYTPSLQGAARRGHSPRPRALHSSGRAAGGQGHLGGSCWEADWHLSYTNTSHRLSRGRRRNNVLGRVKPQSAEEKKVYLWSSFRQSDETWLYHFGCVFTAARQCCGDGLCSEATNCCISLIMFMLYWF